MSAHSQCHVLPPMTVSARRLETVLVWASQDVVNGPTISLVLARCANSLGPIKYRINTRFLSIHDIKLKRYWDNIVRTPLCLLGTSPIHQNIKRCISLCIPEFMYLIFLVFNLFCVSYFGNVLLYKNLSFCFADTEECNISRGI